MANIIYNKQFTTHENDVRIILPYGENIQEIVDRLSLPVRIEHAVRVYMEEKIVLRKYWKYIRPKEMTNIRVVLIPQGGDSSEILKMVAAIAIVVASQGAGAAYAGGPLATATGGAFWGGMAITVGLTVVGLLALNAIFPPPEQNTESAGSSALSFQGARNSSRNGNVVPRLFGKNKYFPPYGAMPFISSEGGKQVLYLLYDFGYGPILTSDHKIGDTLISEFNEVQMVIHDSIVSSSQLVYFSQDINIERINIQLSDGNPPTTRTTSDQLKFAGLDFQFPAGLHSFNDKGDRGVETVNLRVQIYDELMAIIPASEYSIEFDVVDGLTVGQVDSTNYKDIALTSKLKDGFSFNGNIITNDEHNNITIDVSRISSSENGTTQISALSYIAIRSHRNVESFGNFRLYDGINPVSHTMIELRIQVSDQLSGVVDTFNCITSSLLRTWDGVAFTAPIETANPAWIYAEALTGSMNQKAKSDSRINWNELKRFADRCDTITLSGDPLHTCNLILDYETSLLSLIRTILSAGRATIDIFDDYYSVIFEEPQTQKKQFFTNENSTGFRSSRVYVELPHAIKVEFRDKNLDYEIRERIVYCDGYNSSNAYKFETIKATMITSSDEAYRLARYWIKEAELRKETITLNCDLEWLEVKRGQLVGVQMDVMKAGGSAARIKSVNGTVVTVTEKANLNQETVSYFELRPSSGEIISGPVAFFHADSPYEVDIGVVAEVGDLIIFNEFGQTSYDCLVKQITANKDMTATVTLIEHAPQVLDVDNEIIDEYDPKIGYGSNPNNTPLILETLTAIESISYINKSPFISITLKWEPSNGVAPAYYKIYKQNLETFAWEIEGNTTLTEYKWGREILAIDNKIIGEQQIFSVVGVSSNGQSLPPAQGRQVVIVPTGDTTIPPAPDYFVVEDTAENFRRFWWGFITTDEPEDLLGFVIKYTRSALQDWSAASPLHDGVLINPPFEIRALPQGTQTVMIRTIDSSRNLSEESKKITFTMGDRIVENVLFTNEWAPTWTGFAVNGNPIIDASDRLSADTTTSGIMWNANPNILMWNDDAALMWQSPNDSFEWATNITVPAGGITNINWIGDGEVQIYYAEGTYPDDYLFYYNFIEFSGTKLSSFEREFDNAYWGKSASASVVPNTNIDQFGNLEADTLHDISDSAFASIYHTFTTTVTNNYTATLNVRKDSNTSRVCALNMSYGSEYTRVKLNTSDGTYAYDNVGATPVVDVVDKGYYWQLNITKQSSFAALALYLYPAYSTGINDASISSLVDSIVCGGLYLVEGTTPYDGTDGISEVFYNGNGQGIIPYTSPMHLSAGNYTVFIDSPVSVDVNRLSSLTWTTDVPDINEYFDDISVSATGDTVVNLTKTFLAVTNVGITLQSDGNNADSCRIISKTTSAITIRCYSGATQVAGLIDMRVQGY